MKKKVQTRRSFSLKGLTHQRLLDYAATVRARGQVPQTISALIEELVAQRMDAEGIPMPTHIAERGPPRPPRTIDPQKLEPPAPQPKVADEGVPHAAHVTW